MLRKQISVLLLLLAAFPALGQVDITSRTGVRNVIAYGAACGTTSNDSTAFQSALTAAGNAGGGTVLVPACTGSNYYYFTAQILIPSNVTLECQAGAVLRTATDSGSITYTKGTGLVGFYGVSNAGLKNCFVDTYTGSATTPANQPNPIEVGTATPTPGTGTGTRSSNITIEGNTVWSRSFAAAGKYIIWLRRSDNVKVLRNTLDGWATTDLGSGSDTQGVECYGCTNLEVAYNEIRNIGRWGIYVGVLNGSTEPAGGGTDGANIHHNYIEVAKAGIVVAATKGTDDVATPLKNTQVHANIIKWPWDYGIALQTVTGPTAATVMWDNVSISGNTVESATTGAGTPFCLFVFSQNANTLSRATLVSHNTCLGGKGQQASVPWDPTGMLLTFAHGVTFESNVWEGADTVTAAPLIQVEGGSSDLWFVTNRFGATGGHAFATNGSITNTRLHFISNLFDGYGATAGVQAQAFQLGSSTINDGWVIQGNTFKRNTTGTEGYIFNGSTIANNTNFVYRGNQVLHTVGTGRQYETVGLWGGTYMVPTGPSGTNAGTVANVNGLNFGGFNIPGGSSYTSVTITNPHVNVNSQIAVQQVGGNTVSTSLALLNGSFVVGFQPALTTSSNFRYEILN